MSPEHVVLVFWVAVLVVVSIIDVRTRRIPNRIVLPAAAAVLAAQIAVAPERALEWVVAAVGACALLVAAALAKPAGLGMGDAKLALLLGGALGWAVLGALLIGFAAAALAGVLLIARNGWAARKATLPLAPFLAAGAVAASLF